MGRERYLELYYWATYCSKHLWDIGCGKALGRRQDYHTNRDEVSDTSEGILLVIAIMPLYSGIQQQICILTDAWLWTLTMCVKVCVSVSILYTCQVVFLHVYIVRHFRSATAMNNRNLTAVLWDISISMMICCSSPFLSHRQRHGIHWHSHLQDKSYWRLLVKINLIRLFDCWAVITLYESLELHLSRVQDLCHSNSVIVSSIALLRIFL